MPVEAIVGRNTYESTKKRHCEELVFESGKYLAGDLAVELSAWPCTGERGHNCHHLFKVQSANRTITVTVTDDHGGYAANHNFKFGATGTITYTNGVATYTLD